MTNKFKHLKSAILFMAFCVLSTLCFAQSASQHQLPALKPDANALTSDHANKATQLEVDGLVQAPPVRSYEELVATQTQPAVEPIKKPSATKTVKSNSKK